MKVNRKLTCAVLTAAMLAGCGGGGSAPNNPEVSEKKSEDAYYVYGTDMMTADYTITMNTQDQDVLCNLIDGLVEVDPKNNYVPCLATDWSVNDEGTVWTFNLRDDAKWVTNVGEEYGTVVADDFVAGLQHAADFDSSALCIVQNLIQGLDDYVTGKDTNFENVGVKAIDDHTVQYTLTGPCPYFETMANYSILWPINREFLESKGEGCKLGSPDKNACKFGDASDPSSILYCGGYILTANDIKSKQELVKNEDYWDAEHVYVHKITNIYNDGSDPGATVAGFEQTTNPYYQAVLLTTSDNFDTYMEKYSDLAYTGIPSQYSFGANINLNRITYEHTGKTTDKQKEDTKKALLNTNFRRAMKFAIDRTAYMASTVDPSIAGKAIRNMECPYNFVKTSDGTAYGDLVANASTLGDYDMHEGQDPYFSPEKVAEYIELTKEELPELDWPIHIDLMALVTSKANYAMAQSLAVSVQEASNGQIIIDLQDVDEDTYSRSSYVSTGPIDADWDISTSTGWGYDYIDPKTYLHIFSPVDGDVTRQAMGIEFLEDGDAENNAAIEKAGLLEYQKMLEEADAIVDNMDARYKKFAECEAYLLDQALYIPINVQVGSVNWRISRVVPFSSGFQSKKFKGVIIQKDPITAEEYQAAFEEWSK